MKSNKILKISKIFIISFLLLLTPVITYADEVNNDIEEQTIENTEGSEKDKSAEVLSGPENNTEKEKTEGQVENVEKNAPAVTSETQTDKNDGQDNNGTTNQSTTADHPIEKPKVAVITTKVEENGNPLKGAVLQILDNEGNVVDEWVSDGTEHTSLLPEGTYTLHEKQAPEGYILTEDKSFTVKVEVKELDSGVDFSETPCPHYGGTPLYYVEIEGVKSEVYCINQDWETPDENSIYDGAVLNSEDIKNFTTQTVFVDAHQNKEKKDISDQSLSKPELYNKLLDIIYHRQKASTIFSDLTEAEIRYVTESALKNYTNAGLTRVQGVKTSQAPENYDRYDYYINGSYTWYLYPWYRSFVYDPDAPLGKDIFKTVIGEGNAFGNLARHWNGGDHNAKNSEEIRKKIARYFELYQYLISNTNHHPSDMHLYIFATNNTSTDLSGNDFDNGAYQNLLGISWYNPYDENHTINLKLKNEKVPETPKKKTSKKEHNNPQTGDSIMTYIVTFTIGLSGIIGVTTRTIKKEFE